MEIVRHGIVSALPPYIERFALLEITAYNLSRHSIYVLALPQVVLLLFHFSLTFLRMF